MEQYQNKFENAPEYTESLHLPYDNTEKKEVASGNAKASFADCKATFDYLNDLLKNDRDSVRFAYFLWKLNIVTRAAVQTNDVEISYNVGVNFCDNTDTFPFAQTTEKRSRLQQFCSKRLFSDDKVFTFKIPTSLQYDTLCSNNCKMYNPNREGPKFCPYAICCIVNEIAITMNTDPESLFEILSNNSLFKFENAFSQANTVLPFRLKSSLYDFFTFDSNSLLAAASLIASNLFLPVSIREDGIVDYKTYPLCLYSNSSTVNSISAFWKSPNNHKTYRINATGEEIYKKRTSEKCRKCDFDQCPDKVAGSVYWMAKTEGIDPIALAMELAIHSTEKDLSLNENAAYLRYLQVIDKYPVTPQGKKTYKKMLSYIVNHCKTNNKLFLPLNLVIFSSDEIVSEDIGSEFVNAVWYFNYLPSCVTHHISIAKTGLSELIEIINKTESTAVFNITQFELLEQNPNFVYELPKLVQVIKEKETNIIIILRGEKSKLNTFLQKYPKLSTVFLHQIEVLDMPDKDIVYELMDKLDCNFIVSDVVRQKISDFIQLDYPNSHFKNLEYVDDLYTKIAFNHYGAQIGNDNIIHENDIPYLEPPRPESDIFAELDNLTGLAQVKETLHNIADLVKFNLKMKKTDSSHGLHMVFSGNAGTGKTTVANLVSEILFSIGFIKQNKCVVCSSQDLVAGYVGQTAIKTTEVCESAYDGILFIDEAYMLNPYSGNQTDVFKEECIGTLIQQMENNRDRLVVIFAGYEQEMKEFVAKANTGLASRIFETVLFPDYSVSELLAIFENIVSKEGLKITEEAKNKVVDIISKTKATEKNFGNARFARNLFEKSLLTHAKNTRLSEDETELNTLSIQDITY